MSASDIGRREIEERTPDYVMVGDELVDDNGREYLVIELGPASKDNASLYLQPKGQCGNRVFEFKRDETVRVRRTVAS